MGPFMSRSQNDDLSHDFADFYAISAKANDGTAVDFSTFRGKVVMCVNVARD